MKLSVLFGVSCLSIVIATSAFADENQKNIENLVNDGNVFGEILYRYEHVVQDNALSNANAHTVRTNLGVQTGAYYDLSGLIEGQWVHHLGPEDFNSLDNGRTGFSTIADPDTVQLNRAYLEYAGLPDTTVRLGRQFINLDNQRFVGAVDWRQNDQSFDGVWI